MTDINAEVEYLRKLNRCVQIDEYHFAQIICLAAENDTCPSDQFEDIFEWRHLVLKQAFPFLLTEVDEFHSAKYLLLELKDAHKLGFLIHVRRPISFLNNKTIMPSWGASEGQCVYGKTFEEACEKAKEWIRMRQEKTNEVAKNE